MGVLGYIITFVPGAECAWFSIVAALSLFGLFIPKIFYRGAATLLLILSIMAAFHGHQRGIEYRQRLATGQATKDNQGTIAPPDPISRFIADYQNHWGSIAYHSTGQPASADPQEALAKLRKAGLQPGIANFSVIEARRLSPREQSTSRSLTNSAVAVIATDGGQRIVHLRPISNEWWYHVYDSN